MNQIYLIADLHFGDENIRRYENRPFMTVSEMDQYMIEAWNRVVGQEDQVYILGDFGADGSESQIVNKLNGMKFLVKGNHDNKTNQYYRDAGFHEVYDLPVILENFWILSHEPLYVNENMPYANLFGHVHNSPIFKTCSKQHYCVSVERIHYAPISFDQVKEAIRIAGEDIGGSG